MEEMIANNKALINRDIPDTRMRGEGYHHLYEEITQMDQELVNSSRDTRLRKISKKSRNRDTQLQTRVPGRIPERRKTIIRIKSSTRKSLG